MKIATITQLFGPELTPLLTAGRNAPTIKRKTVIQNLLALPQASRMQHIDRFLDRLATCDNEKHRSRLFLRFVERASPQDLSPEAKKTCDLFFRGTLFPNELFPVSEFVARSTNRATIDRLMERIETGTERVQDTTPHTHAADPKNSDRRPRKKSYPYDFNRTGKELSVYLNASDVTLPDGQEYILGSCPYSLSYMNDLFNALIARNTRVMVALHQEGETSIEASFWKNMQRLSLQHGWKASHDSTKDQTIFQTHNRNASIVERTIALTNRLENRSITLLHYVGWEDSKAAPSEEALLHLTKRMDAIGGKIWINCKGGNGRTGELAAIHWGKQKIDRTLNAGTPAAQIALNIPEMVGELRNQRRRMISQPSQLAQVYSTLGKYLTQ